MKLPEISAADIKNWWKRHDQDIGLPDDVIEDIAARGNARAQRLEDDREANRQKHLKPSDSNEVETQEIKLGDTSNSVDETIVSDEKTVV